MTTATPAGIALAAGAGTRLRPLTDLRPKALCPVGNRTLVDLALDRLGPLTGEGPAHLAVNAHHHAAKVLAHFALLDRPRAEVQVEHGEALGTAGAVAALLPWLDGRPALVTNADSYLPDGLAGFTDGWDGERCRLLCLPTAERPDFVAADGTGVRYVGACLLPWQRIRDLPVTPSGLYEVLWRDDAATGSLDLFQLPASAVAIDCGRPIDYLAANLDSIAGRTVIGAGATVSGRIEHSIIGAGATVTGRSEHSVIGAGATVLGQAERSVIWDGAYLGPDEVLRDAIRAGDRDHPLTVPAHR